MHEEGAGGEQEARIVKNFLCVLASQNHGLLPVLFLSAGCIAFWATRGGQLVGYD